MVFKVFVALLAEFLRKIIRLLDEVFFFAANVNVRHRILLEHCFIERISRLGHGSLLYGLLRVKILE